MRRSRRLRESGPVRSWSMAMDCCSAGESINLLLSRHDTGFPHPTNYPSRIFPEAGGLISYGDDRLESWHQTGIYVGRILKGDKPADLPVLQPTKFEFVINLKTAKALGITFPPSFHLRADEVIE
jgi:putative tryptophan/tyrosine transport system substrate-binding protein